MATVRDPAGDLAAFDPRAPAFVADPYPFYARLRERDPVHFVPATNSWWATRYADARLILQDARFGKEFRRAAPPAAPSGPPAYTGPTMAPSMLFRDPPDHTRLRSLVNRAFTPRVVEDLRPRIREVADFLIAQVAPSGEMDVVEDLAVPLPAIVIAELLGVPAGDRDQFKTWSTDIVLGLDVTQPADVRMRATGSSGALATYFDVLIAERRRRPQQDLLSDLIAVEEQGDRLSHAELLSMCNLMLVAGHETTTNLLASGTLALLRHPDQLALLRERPELVPRAVEELLRFESPVQRIARVAKEPVDVGGVEIAAGQVVAAVVAAADRDPAAFPDPDRLDVTRRAAPHLAFGHGIHFCLGAPLARLEGQVVFAALMEKLPDLALEKQDWEPEWSTNTVIRGLKRLPVRF